MKGFLLVIFFWAISVSAQAPDTLWTRTFGGTANDYGYSVDITSDGGYIISGKTYSFGAGNDDVYLIKTDSLGDTLWMRTYGGTYHDWGQSVQQTKDGGYIVAGRTRSFGSSYDVYLIKTDSLGDTLWTKTYGDTADEYGYSVQQTTDTGYIITGWAQVYGTGYTNVYLVKTDSIGDTIWTRTYDRTNYDSGASVKQTNDGGYIVAGSTRGSGYDVWLIKTDENGDTLWTRTFGTVYHDIGHSVCQTADGGYIIVGWSDQTGNGQNDVYLIKTDAQGHAVWTKTYGGPYPDIGRDVKQTPDGGYIITGATWPILIGNNDVYLLKTNSAGDSLWSWLYPAIGKYSDTGFSVQVTKDGGYIIVGSTKTFGAGGADVYFIKFAPETDVSEDPSKGVIPSLKVTPTIFRNEITIRFTRPTENSTRIVLYNIYGASVFEKYYPATPPVITLKNRKFAGLPSGIYFISVLSANSHSGTNRTKPAVIKIIKP